MRLYTHDRYRFSLIILFLIFFGSCLSIATASAATIKQRINAAKNTAQSDGNACTEVRPFYWEIGNGSQRLTGGSVNSMEDSTVYSASTVLNFGSASKWLYGAYVLEHNAGALSSSDIQMLTLRSGYTNLTDCYPNQTVGSCFRYQDNDEYHSENVGKFYYDGGHMQAHAMHLGLSSLNRNKLAAEIRSKLGPEISIGYSLPLLSGGASGSATAYASVLRKMIRGDLQIGSELGSYPVCTNPVTCLPGEATNTPTPLDESWHYSIGHWIEDDPEAGDGSFSSPGTMGFYPWISADRNLYGIVAREADPGNWFGSVQCGRLIREAWKRGAAL